MLSAFSWTDFFIVAGIATLIWILYVTRLINRDAKKGGADSKRSPPERIWQPVDVNATTSHRASLTDHLPFPPRSAPAIVEHSRFTAEPEEDREPGDDDQYLALENLALAITELTARLGNSTNEQDLYTQLRELIQQHPGIDKPPVREAINHLIIRASFQDCGITISHEQAANLWVSGESAA